MLVTRYHSRNQAKFCEGTWTSGPNVWWRVARVRFQHDAFSRMDGHCALRQLGFPQGCRSFKPNPGAAEAVCAHTSSCTEKRLIPSSQHPSSVAGTGDGLHLHNEGEVDGGKEVTQDARHVLPRQNGVGQFKFTTPLLKTQHGLPSVN